MRGKIAVNFSYVFDSSSVCMLHSYVVCLFIQQIHHPKIFKAALERLCVFFSAYVDHCCLDFIDSYFECAAEDGAW